VSVRTDRIKSDIADLEKKIALYQEEKAALEKKLAQVEEYERKEKEGATSVIIRSK